MGLDHESNDNTLRNLDEEDIVGYTIDPDDDTPQEPDFFLHGGSDANQEDVEPAA